MQKGDSKPLYKFIAQHRSSDKGLHVTKISGSSNDADIANSFAQGFHSTFISDNNKMPTLPSMTKIEYPHKNLEVSVNGVAKLFENLNHRKGPGPDLLRPSLLKFLSPLIAETFASFYNYSLQTPSVPRDWKTAHVVPVYKKGSREDALNYRPISLTCISCKIMEHIIAREIRQHFSINELFTDCQHGFRRNRSCESQLLHTTSDVIASNNAGIQTDIIVLDFSKAFDTVSHTKLVQKLRHYEVNSHIINWIEAWLSQRRFYVAVNNHVSDERFATSGVPQGSVLGPVLFLIYINDLPDSISCPTSIRLFADDALVYRPIHSVKDQLILQQHISQIVEWSKTWQLKFNISKCSVSSIKPVKFKFAYSHDNVEFCRVGSFKYLGVMISDDLSFEDHIKAVTAKGSSILYLLMRTLKNASTRAKRLAYFSICLPILEYSSEVWNPCRKKHINKLEAINRRAFRWAYKLKKRDKITDHMKIENWQSLEARRQQKDQRTLFKIYEQSLELNYKLFVQRNENYNTRNGNIRHTINTEAMRNSFFNRTLNTPLGELIVEQAT